jgi:hypothetical protein
VAAAGAACACLGGLPVKRPTGRAAAGMQLQVCRGAVSTSCRSLALLQQCNVSSRQAAGLARSPE